MTQRNQALICAKQKGYIVNEQGDVIGVKGRALKTKVKNEYHNFSIRFQGKKLWLSVHRLAAIQKFDIALFEKGIVTRHLNNNKLDNSLANIAIGTQSQNMLDVPVMLRRRRALRGAMTRRINKERKLAHAA